MAGLQQSAHLLGTLAQQLHTADLALPPYARACSDILTDVFVPVHPDSQPGGWAGSWGRAWVGPQWTVEA